MKKILLCGAAALALLGSAGLARADATSDALLTIQSELMRMNARLGALEAAQRGGGGSAAPVAPMAATMSPASPAASVAPPVAPPAATPPAAPAKPAKTPWANLKPGWDVAVTPVAPQMKFSEFPALDSLIVGHFAAAKPSGIGLNAHKAAGIQQGGQVGYLATGYIEAEKEGVYVLAAAAVNDTEAGTLNCKIQWSLNDEPVSFGEKQGTKQDSADWQMASVTLPTGRFKVGLAFLCHLSEYRDSHARILVSIIRPGSSGFVTATSDDIRHKE